MTDRELMIREKADRLVELTTQQGRIRAEIDEIKAWFENQATDDLRDTKKKTIDYWGSTNSKVVVGNSETVKPISMQMVKKLLKNIYPDFISEETSYTLKASAKRLFSIAYLGKYTEGTLDQTIEGITDDRRLQNTLRKKLKGRYAQDTKCLVEMAGLTEQDASDWAYLVSEVINWEWMLQVLKSAGWEGTPQEAVDIINAAVIVDEGIKVTVDTEKKG